MNLTGQETLPVTQAQAWAALNDTAMLQAAVPGCESITATAENSFDVQMAVSIGPVKAKFKGKLGLADLQPPSSYQISFEGSGGAAGHGKGQAQVRLEVMGPNQTLLHYTVVASVGGKLAQIGSRLVDMAAQKMAEDFFARFKAALIERHPPAVAPAPAEPAKNAWERFLAWYLGWFASIFKPKG
jgi:uncharacterized protein